MYQPVGTYPGAVRLMEFMPRLEMVDSGGYLVSRKQLAIGLFQPLLADAFPGRWLFARCVLVKPNGIIPLHRDSQEAYGPLLWRMLVVQTNPDAWVMHGGTWQHLEQDGIYESDQERLHAAVNFGEHPRVHLVVGTAR